MFNIHIRGPDRARGERHEPWHRLWQVTSLVHGGVLVIDELARRRRGIATIYNVSVDWASDVDVGDPVARASNRVRATIERAADALPEPDGALYRGLVIGDDRDQSRDMIDRFRASGLSHLTAVSGENVRQ